MKKKSLIKRIVENLEEQTPKEMENWGLIRETVLSLQGRKNEAPLREEVMEALQASLADNYDLYRELAK